MIRTLLSPAVTQLANSFGATAEIEQVRSFAGSRGSRMVWRVIVRPSRWLTGRTFATEQQAVRYAERELMRMAVGQISLARYLARVKGSGVAVGQ